MKCKTKYEQVRSGKSKRIALFSSLVRMSHKHNTTHIHTGKAFLTNHVLTLEIEVKVKVLMLNRWKISRNSSVNRVERNILQLDATHQQKSTDKSVLV